MKDTKKKNEKKSIFGVGGTFWVAMAILIILLLLSLILLSLRMRVSNTTGHEVMLESNMDEELDLFSVMYKNKNGDVTVESADNVKVVAPGTEDDFTVCLRNKDDVPLNYTMTVTAELIGQYEIPVKFYLVGPGGESVAGSGKGSAWVDRATIDGVTHAGTIAVEQSVDYKFHWEWPFETGDDEYDTFLANLTGEDVGIQITLTLNAEQGEHTGNFWSVLFGRPWFWWIFFLLLLLAIILLLISLFKRNKKEPEPEPEPVVIPEPEPEPEPIIPIVVPEPEPEPEPVPPPPPPKPKKKEGFVGKMEYVNIDVLDANFEHGDRITLRVLKERGLIDPKTKQMKVLARNAATLNKAFIVETQGVSAEARKYIVAAGGKVIITKG